MPSFEVGSSSEPPLYVPGACILYGGAEFSRYADFAVLASRENLERLSRALDDLSAEVIAVPPFESRYLERGHAVGSQRRPVLAVHRIQRLARIRASQNASLKLSPSAFPESPRRATTRSRLGTT